MGTTPSQEPQLTDMFHKPYVPKDEDKVYHEDRIQPQRLSRWSGRSWAPSSHSSVPVQVNKLKVLTYNVWFRTFEVTARHGALLEIMQNEDPDVMVFQEATTLFATALANNDWIRENYTLSDPNGSTLGAYGLLFACKTTLAPLTVFSYPFPSGQGRYVLGAEFAFASADGGSPVRIGIFTVHLESLNATPLRKLQLAVLADICNKRNLKHFCIMGDFNFDATKNYRKDGQLPLENDSIKEVFPDAIDTWPSLHPTEEGFTFDTVRNKMLAGQEGGERSRLDRVIVSGGLLQPLSVTLLGTEPISSTDKLSSSVRAQTFPSDHFGLSATFNCRFS